MNPLHTLCALNEVHTNTLHANTAWMPYITYNLCCVCTKVFTHHFGFVFIYFEAFITLKTMKNVSLDRSCDNIKMSRLMFTEWLLQNELEIIAINELGFHLWLSRSCGQPRQGQCALRIVGARKGPHFSFILVASNQCGVIHYMILNGSTNIEWFNHFIETLVTAGDNVQLTYLLDNASCHI